MLVDGRLLFDAGEGVTRRLVEWGANCSQVEHVFLSHQHADHFFGFVTLFWQMVVVERRRTPLVVHGLPQVLADVKSLVKSPEVPLSLQNFELRFDALELSERPAPIPLDVGDELRVFHVSTRHAVPSLAFRVEHESGAKLAYGGDGAPNEGLRVLAERCDVLVHEATFPDEMFELAGATGHSTPSQAARFARQARVDCLILTHLPPAEVTNQESFLAGAQKEFPRVELAHDGMEFTISGPGAKLP